MSKVEGTEYRKQLIHNDREINAIASIKIAGIEFMMIGTWKNRFELMNTDDQIVNTESPHECTILDSEILKKDLNR